MNKKHYLLIWILAFSSTAIFSQNELPDPLRSVTGKEIRNKREWKKLRRPELIRLYQEHVYGAIPASKILHFQERIINDRAYDNKAIIKEVTLSFSPESPCKQFTITSIIPKSTSKVPVIMGLNYSGTDKVLNPSGDVNQWHEYPISEFIDRGYGLVTCYYQDIIPDKAESILEYNQKTETMNPPGAISIWAWGLQQMMDYVETQKQSIDAHKVVLYGFSRLGKAALWAGATDERFSIVISNASGCGGAGLFRHRTYESIIQVTKRFSYWFTDKFKQYGNKEHQLPVDQHELISLIAPRPVYIGNAQDDQYVEPMGEFKAEKNAEPVYKLFGLKGVPTENPKVGQSYQSLSMGYHMRKGKHDITDFDWNNYLDFTDRILKRK